MKFKSYMVAAALAATASTNAFAVVDLDSATDQTVNYASEVSGAVDGNGRISVANGGGLLDITMVTGFTIAASTSKYARIDLVGAVFDAVPTLTNGTISQGGASQDSSVIVEVSDALDILAGSPLILSASDYDIDPTVTTVVSYQLFETALDAVNNVAGTSLANSSSNFTAVVSGSSGDFTESRNPTTTVASAFTLFDGNGAPAAPTITDTLGQTDPADILNGTTYTLAGAATVVADYITNGQDITLSGDVSVGAFDLDSNAVCDGTGAEHVALTPTDATNTAAVGTVVGAQTALFVCVDLTGVAAAGDFLSKGSYSLTLETDGLTNSIGSVVYDTTTVEIPYITTFAGYNQRIFIDNRGATDAFYTTSFTTEDGVTAAGGTASTGTVLAGDITVIKAADLVTFTDGSRGSATIEIEAQSDDIFATTQIVDLDLGNTDTLLLQP